jgi:Ca2+-transporting ATPase
MVYCGMVGIKDPARPQVPDSIRQCQEAHIRVIVITGDKKETAMAICSEIGVFDKSMTKHEKDERSFLGKDFMDMADTMTTENGEEKKVISQKQKDVLARGGNFLFARTKPEDKKFIVRVLKENQDIAAMTGDGVNDAPALKAAHIGIAMGISGTEVAKDASDLILADDDFATIVAAVEEGRSIYSNMKAFIRYLISSNIGEVVSVFLTAMLGLPEGLVPVQLLWVNLVTDGPPATALGFNPADPEIMRQPPRSKDEKLIGSWVFFRYMVVGIYVGWATVFVFAYWYIYDDNSPHTPISWEQLSNFAKCMPGTGGKFLDGVAPDLPPIDTKFCTFYNMGETCIQGIAEDPCYYMKNAKDVASTLSLSVLVTIEMFNALNALSEDSSLLVVHPFVNLYLLGAMAISFGLHFVILYIPALADIFNIVPLTLQDWVIVFLFSFPVILIDEVLKFVGRQINRK